MSGDLTRRALPLWLAGLGLAAAAPAHAGLGARVDWPPLQLLDGRRLAATAWAGRPVLAVFFRNQCPYCVRHLQRMQRWMDAGAAGAWRWLGIADENNADAVREHMARQDWRFDTTLAQPALRAQLSSRRVVPLSCVIDRAGLLREVIPGEMSADDIQGLARWADQDARQRS